MTLEEIRGLATEDLKKSADAAREEAFKKRFQSAMESVDNTKTVRELRKRIARIETVLRERQLAASKSAPAAPVAAAAPAGK
jgi:large subunit ribosomal protein L29